MIQVITDDKRCERCPLFEPEVRKDPTAYLNGCLINVNIDIYCKHRFICKYL